ncbi:MAG TPA: glutamyl-tRNA reductase [Myxococcota bacterium]|nr:glutamyl-tRNA reductase [Myxococcota bacterium]
MNLYLVGLSYRTAPVSVRERYAVAPLQLAEHDAKLLAQARLDEGALLSTCNRTELYGATRAGEVVLEHMHRFLREELGDGSAAPVQIYELRGAEVVRHLFRVSGGLDSMVLGEAQILGQVKDAYRAAVTARSCGPVLSRLFQHAFRAAKRIRTETGLGESSVSVARVGVSLAREIFEDFAGKRVLLIGAGEMAESALRGLREAGADQIAVVNRTLGSAVELAARHGGTAHSLEQLGEELVRADIVLSSVQVDRPLLGPAELSRAFERRRGRPLLIVDLGIPRNVDPAVAALDNVYLYDLDDLESTAERGRQQRAAAAEIAREIASQEADHFLRWLELQPHVDMLRRLRASLERTAAAELERLRGEDAARIAEALVAKLLHPPLEKLREELDRGASRYYAEALRDLFGLDGEDES